MWTWGDVYAAADPVGDQRLIILGGIIVAAITAGATVLVAIVNARANRTAPSPPAPDGAADVVAVRERMAVVERRADDNDDRDDVQDRRLDQIERALDLDNPDWRHR